MTSLWVTATLGAIAGLSAMVAWRFAFPPPTPLPVALDRLRRRTELIDTADGPAWKRTTGRRLLPILDSLGLDLGDLRADARVTATNLDAHLGSKAISALLPLGFAVAIAGLLTVSGVAVPAGMLIGVAVVGAAIGFVAPDLALRKEAAKRRREFTIAFGSYLDLVAISLAGGMGTEAALVEAARIGDSWAFTLIRRAVDTAQIEGSTLWATLARLGDELAIPALDELAASVALAGNEGAKVRASIAVKADALRAVELAEAETEAQAATERMVVPTAMLLFGFVILIGYPAVVTVLGGL